MAAKKSSAKTRKAAAVAEAGGVTVKWKGLTLKFPPNERVGADLFKLQEEEVAFGIYRFLKEKLGAAQWEAVDNVVKSDNEVRELFDEVVAAYGTSMGESEASQDS